MARVWQLFADSLSAKQQADMQTVGYTLLDAPQYKVLYGPGGMYNATETGVNVAYMSSLTEQQKRDKLDAQIRQLARTHDDSQTILYSAKRTRGTPLCIPISLTYQTRSSFCPCQACTRVALE
jgi:hypothetical protein